jgi:hypothetical protein
VQTNIALNISRLASTTKLSTLPTNIPIHGISTKPVLITHTEQASVMSIRPSRLLNLSKSTKAKEKMYAPFATVLQKKTARSAQMLTQFVVQLSMPRDRPYSSFLRRSVRVSSTMSSAERSFTSLARKTPSDATTNSRSATAPTVYHLALDYTPCRIQVFLGMILSA